MADIQEDAVTLSSSFLAFSSTPLATLHPSRTATLSEQVQLEGAAQRALFDKVITALNLDRKDVGFNRSEDSQASNGGVNERVEVDKLQRHSSSW